MLRWRDSWSNHWKSTFPHMRLGRDVREHSGVLSPPNSQPRIIHRRGARVRFLATRGSICTQAPCFPLCVCLFWFGLFFPEGLGSREAAVSHSKARSPRSQERTCQQRGPGSARGAFARARSSAPALLPARAGLQIPCDNVRAQHADAPATWHTSYKGREKMEHPGCLLTQGNRGMTLLQISCFWLIVAASSNKAYCSSKQLPTSQRDPRSPARGVYVEGLYYSSPGRHHKVPFSSRGFYPKHSKHQLWSASAAQETRAL